MEEKVILCPMCKMHPAIIKSRKAITIIKDTTIEYEETVYFCSTLGEDDEDAYFIPPKVMDENLLRARNAYRQLKGLLTSDEIVAFRHKFDLSQVELARLLGWGDVTISRYESKAIQDSTYDNELRLIMENPIIMLKMLEKNQSVFESDRYATIRSKISEFITDAFIKRQNLLNYYALYSQPCTENGYIVLNIDKLEQIINYFALKISNLKKVLLMKLLWYSDALSFKENHIAITGLVYMHKKLGALPIGHENIMNLPGIHVEEETPENFDYSIYHILPNDKADFSSLSIKEIKILDKVIHQFGSYNGKKIAKYMHQEYAYQHTTPGQIIQFADAEKIRDF
ncbi:MAG: DUF4065 domain-containing protein [Oscillospiraceae bacterium]|nr:DUF4065 domain-containing protein [Oscillospiraceae bacterium]